MTNSNRFKKQYFQNNRSSLFFRLMMLLVLACLLTAILSAALYYYFGIHIYGRRMADEMLPRARSIARASERYLRGRMDYDSYRSIVLDDQPHGARVFIYDDQGNLFAQTLLKNEKRPQMEPPSAYRELVNQILTTGDSIVNTRLKNNDKNNMIGVVVGVPIFDNLERVDGAVLLTKPSNELQSAMGSMLFALLVSGMIAIMALTILAFFASRRFTKPLRTMTEIAVAMASGDFSARADTDIAGEVGQLGTALNFLSEELSKTISELTLTKNHLTTILSGMNDGVVSVNNDLAVTFCNPAAERLIGKQTLQTPIQILNVVPMPASFSDMCREVQQSGAAKEIMLAQNDRILQISASCAKTFCEDQPDIILLIRDITEAERLEQTRRDYVANVSHELRTPIASIRSLAETLNDNMVRDEATKTRYYGLILRESMRLTRLINDLLELSRLQSGSIALEKSSFSLNGLLRDVYERARINAEYSGIAVQYKEEILPPVFSNPDRIEQVLVALTDNAIKYTRDGGRIILTAVQNDTHVLVEIRNTGAIAKEDLPHLFDRFYKADKAHSGQGTGLGLAITKELLSLLGESIEARNEGEDVVFAFTVRIAAEN